RNHRRSWSQTERLSLQVLEKALIICGRFTQKRNCPGSSAKSGLWPRQRPESEFFQRKFAYRPPLRGATWAPSRGTWAVTQKRIFQSDFREQEGFTQKPVFKATHPLRISQLYQCLETPLGPL